MPTGMLARLFGVGDLSRAEFAQLYVSLGEREGVLQEPRVDDDGFAVHDGEATHSLANIYARFLKLPRQAREPYLLNVLSSYRAVQSKAPPTAWEEAAPRLLPRLRDATFLDLATLDATRRDSGFSPACRPIAPGLFVTLVIDDQHTMTSVNHEMLERWGKSFDDAAERARTNLLHVSLDSFVELCDGLWIAPWDDAYAASRLLLSHVLHRLTVDPLVAVPNRDTLLVARARSANAVGALATAIEKAAEQQSYPLTHRIFRLRDQTLEPFELPADHPAATSHHNMCVNEIVQGYSEQQRALENRLGDAVYVASIEADQARNGRLVTRALWTRGVDTLLPRVDRVHLLYPEERDGEPISSRIWVTHWEELAAVPGALEPTDQLLPRFRTRRFPDEALERIARPVELDRSVSELTGGM